MHLIVCTEQSYLSALQTYLSPRFFNSLVARSPAAPPPSMRYRDGDWHAVGFQDEARSQQSAGHGRYNSSSGNNNWNGPGYSSSEQRSMRSHGSHGSNSNGYQNNQTSGSAPNYSSETRSQRSHGGQNEYYGAGPSDPNPNERRSSLRHPPAGGGGSESRSMRSVGFREAQLQPQPQHQQERGDPRHHSPYAPAYPPSQHSQQSRQQQRSERGDHESYVMAHQSRQQRPGTARNSSLAAAV